MRRLEHAGFHFLHAKGSHHFFYNSTTGRTTSVPLHGGKDIGRDLSQRPLARGGKFSYSAAYEDGDAPDLFSSGKGYLRVRTDIRRWLDERKTVG